MHPVSEQILASAHLLQLSAHLMQLVVHEYPAAQVEQVATSPSQFKQLAYEQASQAFVVPFHLNDTLQVVQSVFVVHTPQLAIQASHVFGSVVPAKKKPESHPVHFVLLS